MLAICFFSSLSYPPLFYLLLFIFSPFLPLFLLSFVIELVDFLDP